MARKAAKIRGILESPKGSGMWVARYRHDGHEVKKVFGRDRASAVAYMEKVRMMQLTGSGEVPKSAKQAVRTFAEKASIQEGVTIEELVEGYKLHIKNDPLNYGDQYNPPIRLDKIKKTFGKRIAESLKPFEISDWLVSLKTPAGKPAAIGTRNRYRGTFSGMYTWAKQREKVSVNPVKDFKSTKEGEGVIRWLDDDEEAKLRAIMQADVDKCDPFKQPTLRKRAQHRIWEMDVALGTGVRRGEQYRLTDQDVNFERKAITLNRTKYGPGRVVHMIDDVANAIRNLQAARLNHRNRSSKRPNKAPANSIFWVKDNKKWFKNVVKRAKIKHFRWHDLRHTFISRLVQKGYNLKVVQEAAGHRNISMTARYAHLNKTNVSEAMDSLNRPQLVTKPAGKRKAPSKAA